MGCVQCGVGGWGGYEISYVSWRRGVWGTWGKCCYVYMRIVIGRFMVSYYVCGAFIYTIYVSYMYVESKAVPLQARTGPEGYYEVKVPRFCDNGTGWC